MTDWIQTQRAFALILILGGWMDSLCARTSNEVSTEIVARIEAEKRLNSIILPNVKLDGVTFSEAVDYLKVQMAKSATEAQRVSVVIELNPSIPELIMPTNVDEEVRAEIRSLQQKYEKAGLLDPAVLTNQTISLNVADIPAFDILKLVADLAGMPSCIRSNQFVFGHQALQREVRIEDSPRFGNSPTNQTTEQAHDLTTFFKDAGVPIWAIELPKRRLLILIGTREDFELLDRVR